MRGSALLEPSVVRPLTSVVAYPGILKRWLGGQVGQAILLKVVISYCVFGKCVPTTGEGLGDLQPLDEFWLFLAKIPIPFGDHFC